MAEDYQNSRQTGASYLSQISADTRHSAPNSKGIGSIFKSKIFIFSAVGLGIFTLVLVVYAAIKNITPSDLGALETLSLRIDNTQAFIKKYNSTARSSAVRADAVTISSILTETAAIVDPAVAAKLKEDATYDAKIVTDEGAAYAAVVAAVEKAKLNATFDRIYLNELVYLINLILIGEETVMRESDDAALMAEIAERYTALSDMKEKISKNANDSKN